MQLEPTGERVVEEYYRSSPENYLIYLFHMTTYNFARAYVAGRRVLDYGCGSGYGTHHMAAYCDSIVGVDIAEDAIKYADSHYSADNLAYRRIDPADLSPLPFEDASFDTVMSFQVIEHIADVNPYLSEIRRVLKPGGIFICATPDRSTRLLPRQKPWNMWHMLEYDAEGLEKSLSAYFPETELMRMGGRADVLDIEIRRTRRMMWLALPLTLPFVPEAVRIGGLKLLKRLAGQGRAASVSSPQEFTFDEADLIIAPQAPASVNLIAIARKP
ncbi:MAG: class I SAM-dependent methyltransferase [Proteobacteria bacterium]|nr:class I SAM-dependent methyltransferase [Pseudomonadota bacterium]